MGEILKKQRLFGEIFGIFPVKKLLPAYYMGLYGDLWDGSPVGHLYHCPDHHAAPLLSRVNAEAVGVQRVSWIFQSTYFSISYGSAGIPHKLIPWSLLDASHFPSGLKATLDPIPTG